MRARSATVQAPLVANGAQGYAAERLERDERTMRRFTVLSRNLR